MPADCHVARGEGTGGGRDRGQEPVRSLECSRLLFSRGARSGAREVERNVGSPNGNARRGRVRTEAERATHQAFADAEREALGRGHRALERAREFAGAPLHRRRHRATRTRRGKVVAGGGRRREQTARGARSVMAHAGVPHVIISRCAADLRITRSRPLGRPPARPPPRLVTRARPGDRPTSTPRPWPPSPAPPSPRRCRAAASPSRCARAPPATPRATPEDGRIRLPSPPRGGGRDPPRHASRRARARRPATGAPNDLAAVPPRRSPSPR